MAALITTAQELWQGDLHTAFQNKGYFLSSFTKKGTLAGGKAYFPKLAALSGSGQAGPAVGGVLTFVGGDHSQVSVEVVDRYATPLAIKEEDMEKIVASLDYRSGYVENQLAQLGRHADDQIIAAFTAGKNATTLGAASTVSLSMAHIDQLRETFDLAEIPNDGQRVVFIRPEVWSQLLRFKEFSNADYIGNGQLPYAGAMEGKFWQSFNWIVFSRVTVDAGTLLSHNMAWHPSCIGHMTNMEPKVTISQENMMGGQYAIVAKQSMGSLVIDSTGVFDFTVDTNVAPTV